MESRNPVFANSAEFNGRAAQAAVSDPSQWQIDLDASGTPTHTQPGQGRMTLETVVEKTGITLGVLVLAAVGAWVAIGTVVDELGFIETDAVNKAYMFVMAGAIIGLVLSLVNSFKKIVSPALVLAYAVAEGVFVGAFSKIVATWVSTLR